MLVRSVHFADFAFVVEFVVGDFFVECWCLCWRCLLLWFKLELPALQH